MTAKFYGYIEGYYGRMLSWEERFGLLDNLRNLALNTYLYAPKQDPYHRLEWRTPYPKEWIRKLSDFTRAAGKKKVRVVPAIAPGLSFDYRSGPDYARLLGKIRQVLTCGSRDFALLMDDISEELPRNCLKTFSSLGQAHGKLLERLKTDLDDQSITLWFCPTIYTNALIKEKDGVSRYLVDLGATMPGNIPVLWTGPEVVSKTIFSADLRPIAKLLKNDLIIWDNLYADDYCPSRLFLGPFLGRSRGAVDFAGGLLLNPTGLFRTDCLYLALMAGFVNGNSAISSRRAVLQDLKVPKEFSAIADFFNLPFGPSPSPGKTAKAYPRLQKALDLLLWQWKSPLQCEWYPFLYALTNDLRLVYSGKNALSKAWIEKKYPPLLASLFVRDLL